MLRGCNATTHWRSVQFLKYFGAKLIERRAVSDGALVSAAGLTAGIDRALTVANLLRGEEVAKSIQLDIQYAPEPLFNCGLPEKASPVIVAKLRPNLAKLAASRLATGKRVAANLGVQVAE